ncbi:WD40 repeat-like protein [Boletus reticuloceps]|uniref:WD40 repeat-like protein n=1 Tax=Boletus reticuloceps TaxID=495285 RepID=A0A8I3A594_9AGAM|nr:WD40 repeat-like protein [Boletus reticuloceps]
MADHFELSSPPFDSVAQVRFSPTNPDQLLVFLGHVQFYNITANEQKTKFDHRAAVLACTFGDVTHACSGGLDMGVRELDLAAEKVTYLGQHENAVSAVNYVREQNLLITGSWDHPRAETVGVSSHTLPERVYHIDVVNHTLVVAMASRLFHIYDTGWYAIGSVEGQIGDEYFDPSQEAQDKKYAFKCHRQAIDDVDHVWPVNALAFHPVYNMFASAGTVSIWDHKEKRLRQYPKYATAIPSIAFNADGTRLAVGVSYTWDDGEKGAKTAERPAIWIRTFIPAPGSLALAQ